MGNCNHLTIIQKIPEQHTANARNQGNTEKKHIGHCTHSSESTDIKNKRFNTGIVYNTMNSDYRIAATLYSLEAWFVVGI